MGQDTEDLNQTQSVFDSDLLWIITWLSECHFLLVKVRYPDIHFYEKMYKLQSWNLSWNTTRTARNYWVSGGIFMSRISSVFLQCSYCENLFTIKGFRTCDVHHHSPQIWCLVPLEEATAWCILFVVCLAKRKHST